MKTIKDTNKLKSFCMLISDTKTFSISSVIVTLLIVSIYLALHWVLFYFIIGFGDMFCRDHSYKLFRTLIGPLFVEGGDITLRDLLIKCAAYVLTIYTAASRVGYCYCILDERNDRVSSELCIILNAVVPILVSYVTIQILDHFCGLPSGFWGIFCYLLITGLNYFFFLRYAIAKTLILCIPFGISLILVGGFIIGVLSYLLYDGLLITAIVGIVLGFFGLAIAVFCKGDGDDIILGFLIGRYL